MRVTQSMMSRNYLARVNLASKNYDDSMNRIANGRSFTKMSENVVKGARSLRLRTDLYRNAQLQDNTKAIQESLTIAENNLTTVETTLGEGHYEALRIQNGVFEQSQLDTISVMYEEEMRGIMQNGNAMYGDDYVFSGTKADAQPFTVGEYNALGNELYYNNVRVSDINKTVNFAQYFDVSAIDKDEPAGSKLSDLFPEDLSAKSTYAGTWNADGTMFTFKTDSGREFTLQGDLDNGYTLQDSNPAVGTPTETIDLSTYSGYIKKVPVSTSFSYQADPASYTYYDPVTQRNVTTKLITAEGDEIERRGDGYYYNVGTDEKIAPEKIDDMQLFLDEDHGGITQATGFYSTDEDSGLFQGNYIRDDKTGFFYEINRDCKDGDPLTYTNEYGERVEVPEGATRYAVQKVPYSDDNFIDVGLGLNVTANGINQNSVIQSTVSGLDAFGFGKTDCYYSLESDQDIPYAERSLFRKLFDCSNEGIDPDQYDGTSGTEHPNNDGDGVIKFSVPDNVYSIYQDMARSLRKEIIPDELRPTYEALSDADKALVKSALAGETQADVLSTDKNYVTEITDTAGHKSTIGFSAADVYEATKTYNETYFAVLDNHLVDQTDSVVKEITGIGIRYAFLENNLQRLELEEMTLGEMQHQIEGIDEIEEDNNLQMNKLAWTLTLQYGSQYLPQTLMDYIA